MEAKYEFGIAFAKHRGKWFWSITKDGKIVQDCACVAGYATIAEATADAEPCYDIWVSMTPDQFFV